MRYVVIIAFILIISSLGAALFFMMRDQGKTNWSFYALASRVGFSVALFLFILFSYEMGWIHPTGIR